MIRLATSLQRLNVTTSIEKRLSVLQSGIRQYSAPTTDLKQICKDQAQPDSNWETVEITEQQARFDNWLQNHRGIIIKITRAFTESKPDFDDLSQEILLQIWKSIPAFREHAKASTWIYRVSLNRALLWQRTESKRQTTTQTLGEFDATDQSLISPQSERVDSLYRAIRQLKKADRALILLALDGMSYREISRISDLSESNVGVRLTRIKKQLHHHLTQS